MQSHSHWVYRVDVNFRLKSLFSILVIWGITNNLVAQTPVEFKGPTNSPVIGAPNLNGNPNNQGPGFLEWGGPGSPSLVSPTSPGIVGPEVPPNNNSVIEWPGIGSPPGGNALAPPNTGGERPDSGGIDEWPGTRSPAGGSGGPIPNPTTELKNCQINIQSIETSLSAIRSLGQSADEKLSKLSGQSKVPELWPGPDIEPPNSPRQPIEWPGPSTFTTRSQRMMVIRPVFRRFYRMGR